MVLFVTPVLNGWMSEDFAGNLGILLAGLWGCS
jgi:hypothetical protein